MNVSLRWLEDFLRRELDARDVSHRLAMLGAPVDALFTPHLGSAVAPVRLAIERSAAQSIVAALSDAR